jgi:hypothetical protein
MARIIANGDVLDFVEEKIFVVARCLGRIILNYSQLELMFRTWL